MERFSLYRNTRRTLLDLLKYVSQHSRRKSKCVLNSSQIIIKNHHKQNGRHRFTQSGSNVTSSILINSDQKRKKGLNSKT